jgi:hypothetical protein
MRTWIAKRPRQLVRPVGKEHDIWAIAVEIREVPRAIDIRDLFQTRDHGRTEDERKGDIGGAASMRFQLRETRSKRGDRQRRKPDQAYEPTAAGVNEIDSPPAIRADPGLGRAIVEKRIRDTEVETPGDNCRDRQDDSRDPGMPSRNSRCDGRLLQSGFFDHGQKLRLV